MNKKLDIPLTEGIVRIVVREEIKPLEKKVDDLGGKARVMDQKLDMTGKRLSIVDKRLNMIDKKLDEQEDKVDNFKDEILTAIDEVLGEVKDMREEQTLIAHRLSSHSDTLENHEGRISKLESLPLQ